jgi:hypothetical protein
MFHIVDCDSKTQERGNMLPADFFLSMYLEGDGKKLVSLSFKIREAFEGAMTLSLLRRAA